MGPAAHTPARRPGLEEATSPSRAPWQGDEAAKPIRTHARARPCPRAASAVRRHANGARDADPGKTSFGRVSHRQDSLRQVAAFPCFHHRGAEPDAGRPQWGVHSATVTRPRPPKTKAEARTRAPAHADALPFSQTRAFLTLSRSACPVECTATSPSLPSAPRTPAPRPAPSLGVLESIAGQPDACQIQASKRAVAKN